MRILHCTCAILAILTVTGTAQGPADLLGENGYIVFLRGVPIGREEIVLRTDSTGTVVTGRGSTGPPLSTVFRSVDLRYDPAGNARSFALEGSLGGEDVTLRTTFANGIATTNGAQGGQSVSLTSPVSPQSVVLPSGMFAGFAALSPRLATAAAGTEFPAFILPAAETRARVVKVTTERIQRDNSLLEVRRYEIAFKEATGDLIIQVTTLADGKLVRVTIPSQALDLIRSDVATATSRTDIYSNPGDRPVTIPAPGFNLGATLTIPPDSTPEDREGRRPAVVLIGGTDARDRDTIGGGTPAIGQLAGALANAGFITVRYDRRGTGQSGGRAESADLGDYADDLRTVVRWLSERKDVDSKKIGVLGHDTGAWIAMLAASRDRRIAALLTLASPASPGTDLALEQQSLQLDRMRVPAAERQAKVSLQKQLDTAVLTGKGWERIPQELRHQADTPWFQSFLAFDPTRVADDVGAPILIVHGDLDREVPVAHAERLAAVARNGEAQSVELVTLQGINHLLQPAVTGDVGEYQTLSGKPVGVEVSRAVVDWLGRTFKTAR